MHQKQRITDPLPMINDTMAINFGKLPQSLPPSDITALVLHTTLHRLTMIHATALFVSC